MKYSILINQKLSIDNSLNLDIVDLAIFEYIKDFSHSNDILKFMEDWKVYYWISYQKIIDDMPILSIKTKDGIYRRIKKLIKEWILEENENNAKLWRSYFCFWQNYNMLVLKSDPSDEKPYPPGWKTVPPSDEKSDDNTITDKTIKIYSSKEESHDVVVSEKKEYWDKNINIIIETIKKNNNWIIDWTVQANRRFWKLLKDKIDKIIWFNWDYEWFIWNLIQNTDKYQISNTTSCEWIFYNLSTLIKKIQMSNNPEPRGVRTITV